MLRALGTRSAAIGLAATFALGTVSAVWAQDNMTTPRPHHRSFIHRHPNLTSGAAGYGAYRYARSRRHGFMHRHPYLTGAVAAGVTHHYLRKHNRRTEGQ